VEKKKEFHVLIWQKPSIMNKQPEKKRLSMANNNKHSKPEPKEIRKISQGYDKTFGHSGSAQHGESKQKADA
jgi:hypothetical protein